MRHSHHRWQLVVALLLGLGVAVFAKQRGWFTPPPSERSLRQAVAGADRIRVRTGGTCNRDVATEKLLFEETEPARIAAVIESIRIDPVNSGSSCPCCGQLSIEFHRAGRPVVTLGYHGRLLRWEGWRGDGALTPDAATALKAWLLSHGVEVTEDTP